MSFEGLQQRLTALQDTTSQLRELIDRLANLKFQPGSVPLDTSEEGSVSGELSVEIQNLLREGDEERELLLEEVEYLREKEKNRLRDSVERVGHELESSRRDFRKARLAAKKSLTQAQRQERQLLVQSYSLPSPSSTPDPTKNADADADSKFPPPPQPQLLTRHRNHNPLQNSSLSEKDRQAVGASSRVTDSLRQMHASLASELERSEYAQQTMRESAAAFGQLSESYGSLEEMLKKSRSLLGTLITSQKSDTWYLTTSLYMLMTVGAWLVFRRWLYWPIWWLVLWPMRLLFGVSWGLGNVALQAGRRSDVKGQEGVVGKEEGSVSVEGIPERVPTAKVEIEVGDSGEGNADMMEDVEKIIGEEGKVEQAERPKDEL